MNYSLAVRNIVLLGVFQPSNYDKYFFIKNHIVTEDEILPISSFNTDIVQLFTDKLSLVIIFNQIIINSNHPEDKVKIDNIINNILKQPSSSYTAIGINFHWNIDSENNSLTKTTRDLFYDKNNKLFEQYFQTEDANYGLYVSKNFKNCRLKLDVKPQVILQEPNKEEKKVVNFAFNFHRDVINQEMIMDELSLYDMYEEESKKIMSIYGK